mgnify:FL=1
MNHHTPSIPSGVALSVVVPVYNEQESLVQLIDELNAGICKSVLSFEVILIDDGSTDESWRVIEELAQSKDQNAAPVFGIRLRRNFGKAAALTAGIKIAKL